MIKFRGSRGKEFFLSKFRKKKIGKITNLFTEIFDYTRGDFYAMKVTHLGMDLVSTKFISKREKEYLYRY